MERPVGTLPPGWRGSARQGPGALRAMERDYESYSEVRPDGHAGGPAGVQLQGTSTALCPGCIRMPTTATPWPLRSPLAAAMQQIVVEQRGRRQGGHQLSETHRTEAGATFLPLTTIWRLRLPGAGRSGPAGALWAWRTDLVRCDAQIPEDVIGNLLGRTVVAADLDAAIAMARQYTATASASSPWTARCSTPAAP